MRVIAGKARRLPLKCVDGLDTRPTTDRIKETLFNILQYDLEGIRFLDLFSGSGAIGIEALSRGAREAVFVENNRAALSCIRENLAFTRLSDQAVVCSGDVLSVLSRFSRKETPFSIVFMDPPYAGGQEKEVLEFFSRTRPDWITADTQIIVEAAKDTDFSFAEGLGFTVFREKVYKTNKHVFLHWNGEIE